MNSKEFMRSVKARLVKTFCGPAVLYTNIRDRILYCWKRPKQTPMGFKFMGHHTMEDGTWEEAEAELINKCLDATDIFINVGANVGYYCCIALNHGKKTNAFEPLEHNLRYLYKNIRANNWENDIEVFPIALSNRTGLAVLYGGSTVGSLIQGWSRLPRQYSRLTPVSTLDTVLGTRFSGKRCFILVDIEGAEKYMLEGAGNFLHLQPKPIWMVEIASTDYQPRGLRVNPTLMPSFQIFWDAGYDAWTMEPNPRQVTEEQVKFICATGHNTQLSDNFLFIETGREKEVFEAQV